MGTTTSEEISSLHELRSLLSRAEARAAEALTGRAAADARTQRALTLFAAVSRVWDCRTRAELFGALDEIASAVLGRRIAVYLLERDDAKMQLAHTNVAAAPVAPTAVLGEGPVGRATAERRRIGGVVPGTHEPVVAVPLGASPQVIGALLLYTGSSAALDVDQLHFAEIVARHAGNALTVLSSLGGAP